MPVELVEGAARSGQSGRANAAFRDLAVTTQAAGSDWAAASELHATGETVRKRRHATLGELTAQETQVARLASEGLSNPEIGTRLFISARTVQYHLSKVFTKMNITSRNQLSRALDGGRGAAKRS